MEALYAERKKLFLQRFNEDPRGFIDNLYLITRDRVVSPYIEIPDRRLCCSILSSSMICPEAFKSTREVDVLQDKKRDRFTVYIGSEWLGIRERITELSIEYNEHSTVEGTCLPSIPDGFIGSDPFTHEMFVAYFIELYMLAYPLPTFVRYLTMTLCSPEDIDTSGMKQGVDINRMTGIKVIEPNLQTLEAFSSPDNPLFKQVLTFKDADESIVTISVIYPGIVEGIIRQVLLAMEYLQRQTQFIHGSLHVRNIFVTEGQAVSPELHVDCPLIAKIGGYSSVNMTVNLSNSLYRLYNRDWTLDPVADIANSHPAGIQGEGLSYNLLAGTNRSGMYGTLQDEKYGTNHSVMYHTYQDGMYGTLRDEKYYILDKNFTYDVYRRYMYTGALFYKSFDIYMFFVTLAMLPAMHYSMFSTSKLSNIWNVLWFSDDGRYVYNRIRDVMRKGITTPRMETNLVQTTIEILHNVKLKCNALELVIQVMNM